MSEQAAAYVVTCYSPCAGCQSVDARECCSNAKSPCFRYFTLNLKEACPLLKLRPSWGGLAAPVLEEEVRA
jgi:hypothetical protein